MKAIFTVVLLIWTFTLVITDHLQCSYNTREIWTNPRWADMRETSDNCMDNMKALIQQEVNISTQYLVMGTHFSMDTISRPGFAQMFFEAASDRREQTIKLISYLLMRGEISFDVVSPFFSKIYDVRKNSWTNGEEALRDALQLEAAITKKIKEMMKKCEDQEMGYNDFNLVDYLIGKILKEQYKIQGDIAGKFSTLSNFMDKHGALGEFLFDKKLLNGEMDHGYEFHGLLSAETSRRVYAPEEDDPDYNRYFLFLNENGSLMNIDLRSGSDVFANVKPDDVSFDLYNTKKAPSNPYIFTMNTLNDDTFRSNFDSSKITVFVSHGWQNDRNSSVITLIRAALLGNYDINVIIVDWSVWARKWNYLISKAAVPGVGKLEAQLVNRIQDLFNLNGTSFVLIGYGLGAHVAGHAGKNINKKVEHIIGLDPARPGFLFSDKKSRLADTDATVVQVIHTNGGKLGFLSSIGRLDFFPNGGERQPGCGTDLTGVCSHRRAYQYLTAVFVGGQVFESRKCSDYISYKNGKCDNNPVAYMGQLLADKENTGDFFLDTK